MSIHSAWGPELALGLPFPQLPHVTLNESGDRRWPHSPPLQSVSEVGINDSQGTSSYKISLFY